MYHLNSYTLALPKKEKFTSTHFINYTPPGFMKKLKQLIVGDQKRQ